MREDIASALSQLKAIDPEAHEEVELLLMLDLEALEGALAPNEHVSWIQNVMYNTDTEGEIAAGTGTLHSGILGLTNRRMIFIGDGAAADWSLSDITAVRHSPARRKIFGPVAKLRVFHKTAGSLWFLPGDKQKAATARLVSILEDSIRRTAVAPPSADVGSKASIAEELVKLGNLYKQGVLDDHEFAAAKARLLAD